MAVATSAVAQRILPRAALTEQEPHTTPCTYAGIIAKTGPTSDRMCDPAQTALSETTGPPAAIEILTPVRRAAGRPSDNVQYCLGSAPISGLTCPHRTG